MRDPISKEKLVQFAEKLGRESKGGGRIGRVFRIFQAQSSCCLGWKIFRPAG